MTTVAQSKAASRPRRLPIRADAGSARIASDPAFNPGDHIFDS